MRLITEGTVLAVAVGLILVPAAAALVAGGILLRDAWRARRAARGHENEAGR